jgi:coenzyme F420-dependent glucose-6-phosphate dehydrogenase
MAGIGYALASEDWPPRDLVALARRAEESGFEYAFISDHIHPWVDKQGSSPFVWGVLGGIAEATERLRLATGVTCPLIRMHPAIVAHAAATAACLMRGRFFLGVGTGENLNEHVLGHRWPAPDERVEMLEEAIDIMRLLWKGGEQTHRGKHYTVDHCRIYDLPDDPIDIAVAAGKPVAATLAGRLGDALINTAPDREVVESFEEAGGRGKPKYGMLHVCYGEDEEEARRTAHELWPNLALGGSLGQELPRPQDFEAAAELVTREDVAETVPCGPDADRHRQAIKEYEDAGYDHVFIHQIGPDQEAFFRFYESEVLARV